MDDAGATDRLLERGTQVGVEAVEGGLQHGPRHPQVGRPDAVEPLAEVAQCGGPAMLDVLADRPHLLEGCRDVELGSWQGLAQEAHVERATAQVEGGHHGSPV